MATFTGHIQIFHSDTSIVDSTQKATLGARAIDKSGNEYVYLLGVASTVAGDWVVYNESYATTRLVADEVGPVAIAMAAITADEYGWYQIFGVNTVARTDTIAADKALYIDASTGRADDLGVAGDLIIGAYSMTADTSNVATVFIIYPSVSNDLGGGATYADNETPGGTINGTNAEFTLANAPSPAGSLILILNGAVQTAGGVDYTLSSLTITYVTAPLDGSAHKAWYRY